MSLFVEQLKKDCLELVRDTRRHVMMAHEPDPKTTDEVSPYMKRMLQRRALTLLSITLYEFVTHIIPAKIENNYSKLETSAETKKQVLKALNDIFDVEEEPYIQAKSLCGRILRIDAQVTSKMIH